VAQLKGNMAGRLDFARHDKLFVRLRTNCEIIRRYLAPFHGRARQYRLKRVGVGRVSARNITHFHPDMLALRPRSLVFYLSRVAAPGSHASQSRF
jgi:hypothetical protein